MGFKLEHLTIVLLCGGGLAALGGEYLSIPAVKEGGIVTLFVGVVVFGLNMIVSRRAEISTPYSSSVNPTFHVFRGWAAVSWGVGLAILGSLFVGFALITTMNWTAAGDFFGARPGIVVALAGIALAACGLGQTGHATHLYRTTETAVSRTESRLYGALFMIPVGTGLTALGLLHYLAPRTFGALKDATVEWVISLIPR